MFGYFLNKPRILELFIENIGCFGDTEQIYGEFHFTTVILYESFALFTRTLLKTKCLGGGRDGTLLFCRPQWRLKATLINVVVHGNNRFETIYSCGRWGGMLLFCRH